MHNNPELIETLTGFTFLFGMLAYNLCTYATTSYFLYRITQKTDPNNAILSFIPFARIVMLNLVAKQQVFFSIFYFLIFILYICNIIPLIGLITFGLSWLLQGSIKAYLWAKAAKRFGENELVGLLAFTRITECIAAYLVSQKCFLSDSKE